MPFWQDMALSTIRPRIAHLTLRPRIVHPETPDVPFRIASRKVPTAVVLIANFHDDLGPGRLGVFIQLVDVLDDDVHTRRHTAGVFRIDTQLVELAEAAEEAGIPKGVMNVIVENGLEGGQLMTTDERVDLVSFTGSCTVGVKVAQQAAPTLKRLVLELGGKSAQIYLPDSVDRAASAAPSVCLSHAGQGCVLGTRVFVPEESKQKVLDGMAAALANTKIGPASDPETQLGPVISAAQRDRCEHFTNAAVEAGGKVVCGGKRPDGFDKGFYWEPTVLDLPDNQNPAAQEEIFGPVIGVIGYRDLDHAVEMANDSKFGLSGWVHGADKMAALDVGKRIRSGAVNINGAVMSSHASGGGIKMSGLGRERGVEGLREFQMQTTFNIGG